MKIVTTETMRDFDRITIQSGTSSEVLMYRAACGIKDAILRYTDVSKSDVLILCGSGNNGGDGYALALLLAPLCKSVSVLQVTGAAKSKDAKYYETQCLQYGINTKIPSDDLRCDIVVDAVFGAGFDGELPDCVIDIFRKIKTVRPKVVVAVDVPSGVDSDGQYADPDSLKADLTVTFHCRKRCHVLPYTASFCGKIYVADIELTDYVSDTSWHYIDEDDIWQKLPVRSDCGHKGTFGTLLSAVGCKRYQGAATLSIMAALRCGCGIVEAMVPDDIHAIVSSKISSGIVIGCPSSYDGCFANDTVQLLSDEIQARRPGAILFGSGVGKNDALGEIVSFLLQTDVPLIFDGDGIGYVTSHLDLLKKRKAPTIITPHVGEFARLCERPIDDILFGFYEAANEFVREYRVTLVLKSDTTMIMSKDGVASFLRNPNSGLAKGGSGDVLAGMIASFAAQGVCAEDSALLGVYFHSAAGKLAAEKYGKFAMLPEDVILNIPRAILPFEKN